MRIQATAFYGFLAFVLVLMAGFHSRLAAQVSIDGNAAPRIMTLGDSITAGYSLAVGGYRAELASRLQANGYNFAYVGSQGTFNPAGSSGLNHEGHSGWTTPEITSIVNGSLDFNGTSGTRIISTSNPDVVLLMIGTNDMIGSSSTLNGDYDTLLASLFSQKPSLRVIVFPMIYCSVFSDVQADNITYGGRDIQFINGQNIVTDRSATGLVHTITGYQQAGRRITFFDGMSTVVTPANCHDAAVLVDGVHPTARTYQSMGDAVLRAIQDVTPGAVPGTIVPTAPSGLKAVAHGNGFILAWTANSLNESGFLMEASTDPLFQSGIITLTASAGQTTATWSGLQQNAVYYLRVSAVNAAGSSARAFPIQATTGTGSTSQVSMPTLSPTSGTYSSPQTVTMSSATSGAIIHYTTDGTNPSTASAQYASAISVGATSIIKAIAVESGSADSAIATASYTIQLGGVAIPAPSACTAAAVSSTQINLTWTNPGSGPTGIRVERDNDPGFANPFSVELPADSDSYKMSKLSPSTLYYFRLRAVKDGATSSPIAAQATTLSTIQLTMVGDSITAGWSYPGLNKGIAGDQSPSALDRFYTDVVINRPRLVTIMIGTNDIANGIPTSSTQANITAMIQEALQANIGVILGTIPPAGDTALRPDVAIDAMNAWIADTAQRFGLTLADYHGALWPYDPINYVDGLHPNSTGYGKMSTVLDAAVLVALSKLQAGSYGSAPPDEAPPGLGAVLTGTLFGRDGDVGLAFDGDITTLYESSGGSNGSGGYVGIDLGLGNARRISGVQCYPRSDALFTRAFGGRFQGSNTSSTDGFVDLAIISLVPVQGRWEKLGVNDPVGYRWLRYYSPTGGLCSMEEVQFIDAGPGTSAAVVSAPTFSPSGGTYTAPQMVTLSTLTAGATIHYTLDGSAPSAASPTYGGAISVTADTAIRAIATENGMLDSSVTLATYVIQTGAAQQASTPVFAPGGGTYTGSQVVMLNTSTIGATIHYTLDGNVPNATSPVFATAIRVAETTTIKAIASKEGMTYSAVAAATYFIQGPAITSNLAAAGTVGIPFSYEITSTASPTGYTATGLPAGIAVDPVTGMISGTPTVVGAYRVVLGATGDAGTATAILALSINAGPAAGAPSGNGGRCGSGSGFAVLLSALLLLGIRGRRHFA